jgi:hypothetical protein
MLLNLIIPILLELYLTNDQEQNGDAATAIPISKNIGIVTIPKSCNPLKNCSATRGTLPKPSIAKKKTVETRANPKAIGMPVARTAKVATIIQTDSINGDI